MMLAVEFPNGDKKIENKIPINSFNEGDNSVSVHMCSITRDTLFYGLTIYIQLKGVQVGVVDGFVQV